MSASPTEGTDMNQIEKVLSDYLGDMCGMRLKPHALTGLAKAAIAAMQPAPQEPVAWLYTDRTNGRRMVSLDMRSIPACAETPLYAHPPEPQWQGIESAPRDGTFVLGFGPHNTRGSYREVIHWWGDRWTITWMEGYGEPTHWMPLPTPPAGGSDEQNPA